jgi:hypothetical protein
MVLREAVGVGGLVALLVVFGAACEDDNLVTGPTPAGVTTGVTVAVPSSAPSSSSTLPPLTTGGANGGGGGSAAVVTDVELQVRQSVGGCWEVLAPGDPAAVTRQDLWYPAGATCEGPGWSIALQIFDSTTALQAATQVPSTATTTYGNGTVYRNGTVLMVVAATASPSIESVVSSVPGFVRIPS